MNELETYDSKIWDIINPFILKGKVDITELAKIAQGATPYELFRLLENRVEIKSGNAYYFEQRISFPEPNPVDFDWRFTEETTNQIINEIQFNSKSIGCFGVPSVFIHLKDEPNVKLFDINPFLREDLQNRINDIHVIDLNSEEITGYNFDIIIMDPPWYFETYLHWFKQAINNLKLGGTIYCTLIPPLVRPTSIQEWSELMSKFNGILELNANEIIVEYETPFFEHETFEYFGLGNVGNWRNTKLKSFKLIKKQHFQIESNKEDNWKRYRFGNKTVSIKVTVDDSVVSVLSPYPDGSYTLRSVSNRDIIKNKVNFITSRNKALIVNGSKKVDAFLEKLSTCHDFNKSIEFVFANQDEIESFKIIHSLIGL